MKSTNNTFGRRLGKFLNLSTMFSKLLFLSEGKRSGFEGSKLLIVLAISLLSFLSCTGQDCDPVYIDDPQQDAFIDSLNSELATSKLLLISQGDLIGELQDQLAVKPDTIYKESEFITVAGIEYKVSEISKILPMQVTDTIEVGWCEADPTLRKYMHEGEIDVYPHNVSFASANKGWITILFEEPFTPEIKTLTTLKVQRIVSHEFGRTQYKYLKQ